MKDSTLDEVKVNHGKGHGELAQLEIQPWTKLRSVMIKILESLLNSDG